MMVKYLSIPLALILSCCIMTSSCGQSVGLKVVIIRHGEKPDNGDNLSCAGFNRSVKLPQVLDAKFGVASYIYVPKVKSAAQSTSSRMFQTATPYAVKHNLAINSTFKDTDSQDVAADILKHNGVVLVVWEHNSIPSLAKAFGLHHLPHWGDNDFDGIWVITFSKKGNAVLAIDNEGITPAAGCPF
jgi:hypothetical protein